MALSGGAPKEMLDGVETADWSSDGASLAVIRSEPHYQLEFPIGHVLVRRADRPLYEQRLAKAGIYLLAAVAVFGSNALQNWMADRRAIRIGNACLAFHAKY